MSPGKSQILLILRYLADQKGSLLIFYSNSLIFTLKNKLLKSIRILHITCRSGSFLEPVGSPAKSQDFQLTGFCRFRFLCSYRALLSMLGYPVGHIHFQIFKIRPENSIQILPIKGKDRS